MSAAAIATWVPLTPPVIEPPRPPGEWVDHVVELVAEAGLPPLMLDPQQALQVDGRWELYPWLARRDASALLAWMQVLDGPVTIVNRPAGVAGGPGVVAVHGSLAGHPTRLLATCERLLDAVDVPDTDGRPVLRVAVDRELLEQVRALEELHAGDAERGVSLPVYAAVRAHLDDPLGGRPLPPEPPTPAPAETSGDVDEAEPNAGGAT